MHFLGLAGMPRRIPDYPDAFAGWNMVASLGAFVSAAGALLFFYILWRTFTSGEQCPANPWGEGATTLEWTVSSPPPFHTFERAAADPLGACGTGACRVRGTLGQSSVGAGRSRQAAPSFATTGCCSSRT